MMKYLESFYVDTSSNHGAAENILIPRSGDEGFYVTWIAKDHEPGPDEDYDSARAEYAVEVFTSEAEARECLAKNYLSGGVEWGYYQPATFEYGGWSLNYESAPVWYYELD